ncbi:MAG: anthranilate synthase component 1 [Planctomycetota bacterium]
MIQPLSQSSADDADRYQLAWNAHPADLLTPVRAFLALRASGHRPCLLESVEGSERQARYSFIGVDPDGHFRGFRSGSRLELAGQVQELSGPCHLALREATRLTRSPALPAGLPPLAGGWVGMFSYEWASTLEPSVPRPDADPIGAPEALFEHYSGFLAFDHATQRLWLMTRTPRGATDFAAGQRRLERLAEDLDVDPPAGGGFRLLEPEPRASMTKDKFESGVERLRDAIRAGEIFQAVPSQRFEQRFSGDPFVLYRVLRMSNPAPHMFFFESDGLTLVGSSPERLVSRVGDDLEAVPIAGTRPRGEDPAEDARLGEELRSDPKEVAEHQMLVDLARNDLGRVAAVGSVRVAEHLELERFQRVQHLVSRVRAKAAPGTDAIDALAATFPAGTVSGAPKVRAMQLVAEVEQAQRGPYAGAFGYLDSAGDMDMAISIRTLVARAGSVHVQAGAGIVFDSQPELEYQETLHKTRALFEAVRLAAEPAFQSTSMGAASEATR